jgi:succinyl-diaminopimelate desuccinylase
MTDCITIAKTLIACPSVTPEDAGAQVYLARVLQEAGFTCYHLPFGEGAEHVPNLFARLGTNGPHLCYGGHTDVVPPGDDSQWTSPPFEPTIKDGVLYGRGASDMKGSVAAFAAAAIEFGRENPDFGGSISLLITGDEEGPAINGTIKVLQWMKANDHIPDVAMVGEPTNPSALGQEIKIGRRGSLSGVLSVTGKQGHVAYQNLADNPLPRLVKMLDALASHSFDEGNEFFLPTNLELTSIDVGNPTENVIPRSGTAMFNIRFNDGWSAETLERKVREILDSVGKNYTLETRNGAESFMTEPGEWTGIVREAVKDITGREAPFTTSGGTSDARFITNYCPVVEFGPVNATIHQIDENAEIAVLEDLTRIYKRVLERYFGV